MRPSLWSRLATLISSRAPENALRSRDQRERSSRNTSRRATSEYLGRRQDRLPHWSLAGLLLLLLVELLRNFAWVVRVQQFPGFRGCLRMRDACLGWLEDPWIGRFCREGSKVGTRSEHVAQIRGQRILQVQRSQTQQLVNRLLHARETRVPV